MCWNDATHANHRRTGDDLAVARRLQQLRPTGSGTSRDRFGAWRSTGPPAATVASCTRLGASFVARDVGPTTIGVLVVAQAVLWVLARPAGQPTGSYVGQFLGAESILLLSIGLVLISTLPWVEEWFDGIDRAAIWHRRVAIAGLVLLAPHILLSSNPDGTALGGPLGVDRGDRPGRARRCGPSCRAGSRWCPAAAGRSWSPRATRPLVRDVRGIFGGYERWRVLHRTTGLFVAAGFLHGVLDGRPSTIRRSCAGATSRSAASALAFYVYRELLSRFFLSLHDYEVDAVREIDEGLVEIALRPIGRPIDFVPGQFAMVYLEAKDGWHRHPFTIASAPREDVVRVTVKALGDYTSRLHELLEPGMPAVIGGPHGRFSHCEGNRPAGLDRRRRRRRAVPQLAARARRPTCRIASTSSTRPTARRRSPRRSGASPTPRLVERPSDRHEHRRAA